MFKKYPSFTTSVRAAVLAANAALPPAPTPDPMPAEEASIREQIRILTPIHKYVCEAYDIARIASHQARMTEVKAERAFHESRARLALLQEELGEEQTAEWEHA